MQVIIVRSVPNKSSLGAINGLAQSLACVARGLAPTAFSSLFALSLQWKVAGGNLVYLVAVAGTIAGIYFSLQLPKHSHVHRNQS